MRYRIMAKNKIIGEDFYCFTWIRDPDAGIERAKKEALIFGHSELGDFRYELIEE